MELLLLPCLLSSPPQSLVPTSCAAFAAPLHDVAELPLMLCAAAAVLLAAKDTHPCLRSMPLQPLPRTFDQHPARALEAHADVQLDPSLRPPLPPCRCALLTPAERISGPVTHATRAVRVRYSGPLIMRTIRQYIEVAPLTVTNVTCVISAVIPWVCLVTCGARVCHCTCHLSSR
jgi:hypothetical protein